MRKADVTRNTLETQITVSINLDGNGTSQFNTGLGFLDHMLDQIARHGLFDINVQAKGDLHIDAHHTVEDIGITLGQAFIKAVGDKKCINRYGHAYVPLDEALSRVVLDLSGRPGLEFNCEFTRAAIGEAARHQMYHDRLPPVAHIARRGPRKPASRSFDDLTRHQGTRQRTKHPGHLPCAVEPSKRAARRKQASHGRPSRVGIDRTRCRRDYASPPRRILSH